MKQALSQSIVGCTTRAQMERAGIKCFVRYAVENPNVYNIVWSSLAVEKEMFEALDQAIMPILEKGMFR